MIRMALFSFRRRPMMGAAILGMLVTLLPSIIYSQQAFILKINPLSLFATTPNIQGEYAFAKRVSVLLGAFGGGVSLATKADPDEKIKFRGVGVTPELRFFPGFQEKRAPVGFYLGVHVRLRYVSASWRGQTYDPDIDSSLVALNTRLMSNFGMGGVLGYQVVFKERFVLDMFAGPQFMIGTPKYSASCPTCNGNERNDYPEGPDFSGMEIRAGVGLGYKFSGP